MSAMRLLLVDDSKVVRMVVAKQLEVLGLFTELAQDGLVAVDKAREKSFDLIFMDVMMPNLDGLEATKRIRIMEQQEGRKPCVIVGVTGYTDRGECLAAGMSDCLIKPVTIEQLKGVIVRWFHDAPVPTPVTAAPTSYLAEFMDRPVRTGDLTHQRLEALKERLRFNFGSEKRP
jgi:CheY-like chemotaxis protein